ncbi:MAG: VOC family protein [Acidimicrobiales bacterium]
MTDQRPRFHLAFPVHDLDAARAFYGGVLGCPEGRSAPDWVDFDLFGHQIVAHLVAGSPADADHRADPTNLVDGHDVPVPHFGLLLEPDDWTAMADRLVCAGTEFVIEPHVRFVGEVGEQSTMFLLDPSGNALEFKSFADDTHVFAR